ncbi:MAG: hypothetical protein HY393_02925 [Candidatus Diapherotrites archaeon]|nr:hypothetical protein [Candidatus Diapherotrites archaeon]
MTSLSDIFPGFNFFGADLWFFFILALFLYWPWAADLNKKEFPFYLAWTILGLVTGAIFGFFLQFVFFATLLYWVFPAVIIRKLRNGTFWFVVVLTLLYFMTLMPGFTEHALQGDWAFAFQPLMDAFGFG